MTTAKNPRRTGVDKKNLALTGTLLSQRSKLIEPAKYVNNQFHPAWDVASAPTDSGKDKLRGHDCAAWPRSLRVVIGLRSNQPTTCCMTFLEDGRSSGRKQRQSAPPTNNGDSQGFATHMCSKRWVTLSPKGNLLDATLCLRPRCHFLPYTGPKVAQAR
jgi:hypothetical protein